MQRSGNYSLLQPMYPLLIQQFVDDYSLNSGVAIDVGTGPGWLGLELAKISDMKIIFLDSSQESLDLAKKNFDAIEVDNAVDFIRSDVTAIPLDDDFADFIMSRGSIWFWEEPEKGLQEIYRILKPGGVMIVGGGLGRYIPQSMRERMQKILKKRLIERNEKRPSVEEFTEMVKKAKLPDWQILTEGNDFGGVWVEIKKR